MAASATNTTPTPPAGADRGTSGGGGGLVAYLNGVREELRKAVWPTRVELTHLTQVVLMIIAVVAVYCGALDGLLSIVTNRIFLQQH